MRFYHFLKIHKVTSYKISFKQYKSAAMQLMFYVTKN